MSQSELVLSKISRACVFLAEAKTLQEIKEVMAMSAAAAVYGRQINASIETVNSATIIRLRAERRLGEMLSDAPKNTGAKGKKGGGTRGSKKEPRVDAPPTLIELSISKKISSRSQAMAKVSAERFERALVVGENEELNYHQVADALAGKPTHVSHNSGENEWYTPPALIEAARAVMGTIDCDPASSAIANRTVRAEVFFTRQQDGLVQEWNGNVWLNCPYEQPFMGQFAARLCGQYGEGRIRQACVLVNNATETAWFQQLLGAAAAVCFPKSRIKFLNVRGEACGAPLQGQAVIYLGGRVRGFAERFGEFGIVLCKIT